MVDFIWLSIFGGVILLITGSVDYYLSSPLSNQEESKIQNKREQMAGQQPHYDKYGEIPAVGKSPEDDSRKDNKKIIFFGYLISVAFQLPQLLSILGVI